MFRGDEKMVKCKLAAFIWCLVELMPHLFEHMTQKEKKKNIP